MFFNRGRKKKARSVERVRWVDLPYRVDLPEPKGEFRSMFEDVISQVKASKARASENQDAPKSEWCIICGKEGCDVL